MDEDPFSGYGLRPVELADRAVLERYFSSLSEPLSDYTFAQLYTWRNSLRILWKEIDGHLCVFANGTGDLTLLMPPIGDTGSDAALFQACDIMDAYNAEHKVLDRSRVEYVSDEILARFSPASVQLEQMGPDYIYDTQRMIDLLGGDLSSKRQAKNRFMRNYEFRMESYDPDQHHDACVDLLATWKDHQDAQHEAEPNANAIKRAKESTATRLCLDTADGIGLRGRVVYLRPTGSSDPWALKGFTFGQALSKTQNMITIEKTDLTAKGLAQFIFSEFCRECWSDKPYVNVGDDWGLETLAWTKQSYRPVKLLQKWVVRRKRATMVAAA